MYNGFILVDKQSGSSSFKLVMALRQKSGQKSVGFAGTLDPLATGLMILALGEYTKLLPYLEISDKVYEVRIRLDGKSDTGDAEGKIEQLDLSSFSQPSLDLLSKIIEQRFLGKIEQIPPRHSAIQVGGRRAYEMARKGEEFQLKARPVEIFSIDILHYEFPLLDLRVHCSSGTYIRSLAVDLGAALGCGGYVEALRRTKIADIPVEQALPIENITAENLKEKLLDGRLLLPNLKTIELSAEEYSILARGNFIELRNSWLNLPDAEMLAIWENKIVGLLEFCENGRKLKFKKKFNIV